MNRVGAVTPHDPARALSLEIALSRMTSPDGWKEHTLQDVLADADEIWKYLVHGLEGSDKQ